MPIKQRIYSLLRSIEKYTKTDMVYLTRGGFWLTFGQGVASVTSFLLAIAFAHFLPKEIYGQYKYIISVSAIIATFTLTGIGSALTRSITGGYYGTIKTAFWINLKWSLFMTLGSIIGAIYYIYNNNNEIGISLIIIAIIIPLIKSFELYGCYLNGRKDFKRVSLFNSIENIVYAISIFITIVLTKNVIVIVGVFFIVNMLTKAIFYYKINKEVPKDSPIDYATIPYSKHLSLINIWLNISAQLDKIIIFHYLGGAELAIYSFSTAIPKQARNFIGLLGPLAMPKLTERSSDELKKSIPRKFLSSLIILGPIVILYILIAPYIYKIFFPQYLDSVFYSQIYSVFILLLGNLSEVALKAKKAIKEQYIISFTVSISNTILMLIMIKYYGILGVILAIIIVKYLNTILSFRLLNRIKD